MHKLFQSVRDEIITPLEGKVTGILPAWLNGSIYRNGPGLFEIGQTKYFHWFDGMAVIQQFRIHDGKVTYQRRFLKSETYKTNMEANRIVISEFGTRAYPHPNQNALQRLIALFTGEKKTDNCPINIIKIGQDLFATSETGYLHRFDPETMDTLERINIADIVQVNQATAHVHYEKNGTMHNLGYSYGIGLPKYCIYTVSLPDTEASIGYKGKLVASLDVAHPMHPSYIHSFSMTDHYYIYLEQPLVINVWKILSAEVRKLPMTECLEWRKDMRVRFHVVDRESGKEINTGFIYDAMPFMLINQGNAYELDGHIVLDLCTFKDSEVLDSYFMANLAFEVSGATSEGNFPPSTYRRFVLPLNLDSNTPLDANLVTLDLSSSLAIRTSPNTISLTAETICEVPFELPTINYNFNGQRYRYIYGLTFYSVPKFISTLMKLDVDERSCLYWTEENCFPSKPVFIATPGGGSEDDGILISAINTTDETKQCFLLFLDAKTMKEICRVSFPVWIPRDLHGIFVSAQ